MLKQYIYLLILFMFISCTGKQIIKERTYEKDLAQFPSFLTDFFPSDITKPYVISENIDTTSRCIYYQLYLFNIDSIRLEDNYIGRYESADPQLVNIKRNTLFEWNYVKKDYYNSLNKNESIYYPLVYFEKINNIDAITQAQIFSSDSKSGLAQDFSIYVYESKSGQYWKGLGPLDYMPNGWKNGYTKGVCFSEKSKILIYWFVIW